MGFLRYNFNPATIFLGDSGSLLLGFMAAGLSLAGSQKGSTIVAIAIPLVSFGLPVTEAGLSLVRRFLNGQSLLAGDRGHIHHRLLDHGLTQRQAAILLYAVCALFSLFALMLLNPKRNLAALVFFVLGVGIVFGVQRLRYAEFSELGSRIKRRRRALAAGARVRRTSDDLSNVANPNQLFAALDSMLATDEFDCVLLELNGNEPIFESYSIRHYELASNYNGHVIWAWKRSGIEFDQPLSSDQCWTLRVPLTDDCGAAIGAVSFYRSLVDEIPIMEIGHLCGAFQRELSAAIVRLIGEKVRG
jgi:UDP-GlcNAc:undecaprenyl-phosphate GlcNAc-1-phosphate transferase